MNTVEAGTNGTLVGWKEIAEFLGVSVSTARRWTRTLDVPAYRLAGQVRASSVDLDKWVRDRRRRVGGR
ncbi:MAG: helix-turn-helix domain-containing protein [Candidatus Zixiibacteriota bacterium]